MPQVIRRARRHIQQAGVFLLALDFAMRPRERIGEVVGDVTIELFVFLVLQLGARTRPQGLGVIDGLIFRRADFGDDGLVFLLFVLALVRRRLRHAHRKRDVVGIL